MKDQINHQDRLQTMKISRIDHLMSYGSGLLLQDSALIEV
jgi:hypothetical protein